MNTRPKIKTTAFLLAITIINASYSSENFYLTGAFGYAYISSKNDYQRASDYAYTLNTNLGYNFNQYISLDLGETIIPSNNSITNYFITDIGVKPSISLSNFTTAYIHLGPAYVINSSNNSIGLFTGIGTTFKVSKKISINIENYGVLFSGANLNVINNFTLGAIYDF